jgi:hypothetical protein
MRLLFRASTFTSLLFTSVLSLLLFALSSCRPDTKPSGDSKSGAVSSPRDTDPFIYLPALDCASLNTDTETSIILSTNDVARFDNKKQDKPYVNAVQIIDADAPWPPRWYTSTPLYSDSAYERDTKDGYYRYDFTIDAKVESGYFSFYKILSKQKLGAGQLSSPEFASYILLNDKMESVDTIRSNIKRSNMFFHDLRINARGERMVNLKKDTYLDLRDYTDDPKDTAVHCNVDHILIQDSTGKTLFDWNPLFHINPDLFNYKQTVKKKAFAANNSDLLEWTRLTSALWDYDGNILYAMKQIGIGKVSREDGHVIWQINNGDIPIISGKDTLQWYSPHDLNILSQDATSVTYSVYSNGNADKGIPACGVIFQIEKKTQKAKLIRYISPQSRYYANGQGNLEYHDNGDYAIGYGFFEQSDTSTASEDRNVLEYHRHNGAHGVYQLPRHIYTYKAHLLKDWPRPPRPAIIKQGNTLTVAGGDKNLTWYKLSGNLYHTVEKVGKGASITPEAGAVYCVEMPYGIGCSVSRIYKN